MRKNNKFLVLLTLFVCVISSMVLLNGCIEKDANNIDRSPEDINEVGGVMLEFSVNSSNTKIVEDISTKIDYLIDNCGYNLGKVTKESKNNSTLLHVSLPREENANIIDECIKTVISNPLAFKMSVSDGVSEDIVSSDVYVAYLEKNPYNEMLDTVIILNDNGTKKLDIMSNNNLGRIVKIYIDNECVVQPTFQANIKTGKVVIPLNYSDDMLRMVPSRIMMANIIEEIQYNGAKYIAPQNN